MPNGGLVVDGANTTSFHSCGDHFLVRVCSIRSTAVTPALIFQGNRSASASSCRRRAIWAGAGSSARMGISSGPAPIPGINAIITPRLSSRYTRVHVPSRWALGSSPAPPRLHPSLTARVTKSMPSVSWRSDLARSRRLIASTSIPKARHASSVIQIWPGSENFAVSWYPMWWV